MEPQERPIALRHSSSTPDIRRSDVIPRSKCAKSEALMSMPNNGLGSLSKNYEDKVDNYACNICFDIAENAVVTSCGHLYCWTCLYQWLASPSQLECPICPMCKAGCDVSSLTPIYGRGDAGNAAAKASSTSRPRTFSSSSQSKPKSILDQWLAPHIHPPTMPLLPPGETPARPMARRPPATLRRHKHELYASPSPQQNSIFGNTHPVVLFSAGVTTLCGMQILNNGGFSAPTELGSQQDNTSRIMWVLAMAIIAGVWFH